MKYLIDFNLYSTGAISIIGYNNREIATKLSLKIYQGRGLRIIIDIKQDYFIRAEPFQGQCIRCNSYFRLIQFLFVGQVRFGVIEFYLGRFRRFFLPFFHSSLIYYLTGLTDAGALFLGMFFNKAFNNRQENQAIIISKFIRSKIVRVLRNGLIYIFMILSIYYIPYKFPRRNILRYNNNQSIFSYL